jgi:hypothetical protein
MPNVKNYKGQGGDQWVIGGSLELTEGGQMMIDGVRFTRADAQANSEATTVLGLKDDLNALLVKLRAAGLIAE